MGLQRSPARDFGRPAKRRIDGSSFSPSGVRPLRTALAPCVALPKEGKRALNDLAIAENGDASMDGQPGGGCARPEGGRATRARNGCASSALRLSPQGARFVPGAREKRAFVAEYGTGIWTVDLATGEKSLVESPPDVPLQGADGLVVHGGEILVTQNGIRPIRVAWPKLDAPVAEGASSGGDPVNSPLLDEPTLGVLVGDDFYYIANPQWVA